MQEYLLMTTESQHGGFDLLGHAIDRAGRIEQAIGHLAKAIELGLVDVALNPQIADDERQRYVLLGQKLAEISGITYELLTDISTATGIPMQIEAEAEETDEHSDILPDAVVQTQPTVVERPKVETEPPVPTPPSPPSPQSAQRLVATLPAPPPATLVTQPRLPVENGRTTVTSDANNNGKNPELKKDQDLYEKLVDTSELPQMRPVEEADAINMVVVTDSRIRIRGNEIKLKPAEVYLLNSLLLLRDKPRSGAEIRALGFVGTSSKTPDTVVFANTLKPLIEKLNRAAGKEIVKKIGEARGTQYGVNPKLVLQDVRDGDAIELDNSDAAAVGLKKN